MLKKIMKAALAASLVFGMSSFAYAADGKIGGSFKEYFGQYTTGADTYDAHFANFGEANLQFTGKSGKASVFVELQADTAVSGGQQSDNGTVTDVQRKVSYESPVGLVSIGTVVNIGTIPMGSSGYKTSNVPMSTRRALVVSGYKEKDGIDVTIPLEGMGFVQATLFTSGGTLISGTNGEAGQTIQLGANLNFDGIGVRVGYSSEKQDSPTNSSDGDDKSTGMLVGAKVPLGDTMAITFDYSNAKVETAGGGESKYSTTDLGLEMGGVGPGKLFIGYDMMKVEDTIDYANLSLVYDIETAKGAGFQFGYSSNSSTPDGGDTTTQTNLLGGIYAAF